MGGNVALNFALQHPEMCRSAVVAARGSGTVQREQFEHGARATIERLRSAGMTAAAEVMAYGPTRNQLLREDPRGWQDFYQALRQHSAEGSALIQESVPFKRPTIFELKEKLNAIRVPVLIRIGDEDEPCVEPAIFMKREIPSVGLSVFPNSGHCINLEEPAQFNQTVLDFLTAVEAGRWHIREAPVEAARA